MNYLILHQMNIWQKGSPKVCDLLNFPFCFKSAGCHLRVFDSHHIRDHTRRDSLNVSKGECSVITYIAIMTIVYEYG